MDKHVQACHSNNKSNGIQISDNDDEDVAGAAATTASSSTGASRGGDSTPLSNATTLSPMLSLSTGLPFCNRKSCSLTSLSPPQPTDAATPREYVSDMAIKKLELCFRKAETYEGMAMVLNISLDRLLTQVTEIDNQRRRESESREAQERKIQVRVNLMKMNTARDER